MKIYFTITGTSFHHGQDFFREGMKVRLEKEPGNKYDQEAIKVMMDGLGPVGYVANSPRTVIGESFSAGRLYDKIGDTAKGKVLYVTDSGVLCVLKKNGDHCPDGDKKISGPEAETETDACVNADGEKVPEAGDFRKIMDTVAEQIRQAADPEKQSPDLNISELRIRAERVYRELRSLSRLIQEANRTAGPEE